MSICNLHALIKNNVVHKGRSYLYGGSGVYGDTASSALTGMLYLILLLIFKFDINYFIELCLFLIHVVCSTLKNDIKTLLSV